MRQVDRPQCVLFDWGDTVMRVLPQFDGPMETWPRVEPVQGVHAVLQALRPCATLALATNAADSDEAAIRKALARCDLSALFDHVFCFRALGHRKPEPSFFEAILAALQLPPTSVFMVGDSFPSDVSAANAAGLPAVWFNSHSLESRTGPLHRTIHELGALSGALSSLGAHIPRHLTAGVE